MDKCLSLPEAREMLRHCLEEGAVIPGKHFREELDDEGLDFKTLCECSELAIFMMLRKSTSEPATGSTASRATSPAGGGSRLCLRSAVLKRPSSSPSFR